MDHETQLTKFHRKNSYKTCPQAIIDEIILLSGGGGMNIFFKYNEIFLFCLNFNHTNNN